MAMNETHTDEDTRALMDAARAELERGAARLDAVTLARLRAARARALEISSRQPLLTGWLPAGAVVLLLAAVTGVVLMQAPSTDDTVAMMSTLDDDYELYENLDFYEWLEADTNEEPV
jgi:hypothetical protein